LTEFQPTMMTFKRHTNVPAILTAGLSLILAGCAVGPNYKRPEVDSPSKFRGQRSSSKDPQLESFASLPWWKVFRDRELQKLIQEALKNNYDLRIAVTRIEQSWAIAQQVRADIIPTLGPAFNASRSRSPEAKSNLGNFALDNVQLGNLTITSGGNTTNLFDLGFSTSWEVDLWGRLRRANQAAYARYFATEDARRGVVITLVATVAQSYFQLRALDDQLSISRRTAQSFKASFPC
jgi:multidrug efflux system outer membrane protein